jgi:excisionase family DNA binding protein
MAVEKLLLKPEEAAEILSIGRSKVYELMGTGELASVRIGACRRIPAEALSDFVAGLRDTSPAVQSTVTAIR